MNNLYVNTGFCLHGKTFSHSFHNIIAFLKLPSLKNHTHCKYFTINNTLRRVEVTLLLCLILLFLKNPVIAQSPNCPNLSFELGNFDHWVGYDWRYATNDPNNIITTQPALSVLPNSMRQEIMTDTSAVDPNTDNKLHKIPPGYKYSARLGYEMFGRSRYWDQSLRYTMKVDSLNALLIVKFAVVLEDPDNNHTVEHTPRFKFTLYDQSGNTIDDCTNYDVYSRTADDFQEYYNSDRKCMVKWRDWTAVGVNLLKYVGQTVTIEFMTQDCTLGGHSGYAYFVAEYKPMVVAVSYCKGDSVATLKGPEGFQTYNWTDSRGNTLDSKRELQVKNPVDGTLYSCTLTSATGCTITLQSLIVKGDYKADFWTEMLDCKSNKVLIHNTSSQDKGYLNYKWDFGDGNSSIEREPQYNFATSGKHTVTLKVSRPNFTCVDSLRKTVESFSPPLVGIRGDSTFCPGKSVNLYAYGAWNYKWNNSNCDSIEVKAPGGKYWMIGKSSGGCVSDTIFRTIKEEPDWEITDKSDSTLCLNGQTKLWVTGAKKYLWNTSKRDTSSSILVAKPGIYKVTASNKRGCEKAKDVNVRQAKFKTDFYSTMLDCRSNKVQITNTSPADSGYQYKWDFGDRIGSAEIDPQHTFATSGRHKVTLATNKSPTMCVDTLVKTIESFSPPLVGVTGDSLFCPGNKVILKAHGAWNYEWSSSSNADTMEVTSPGGKYWLLGRSTTGCVSDTIFKTSRVEPYWELSNLSDSILCAGGDKAILSARGAEKYLWKPSGATSSSIEVSSPGTYNVIGRSRLGCEQLLTILVKEYPLPKAEITTSSGVLNPASTKLLCSIAAENGVSYLWDMGDGITLNGSSVEHTYNLSTEINAYHILLTATDTVGCSKSAAAVIDISDEIFIPNVFSPNGDGINDLFMPESDLLVMDRTGFMVYQGTTGWDGTYKGVQMAPDTYFYLLRYHDRSGKERSRKGFIALVK